MSKTQLRAGHEPKWARAGSYGPTIPSISTLAPLDMSDVLSYLLRLELIPSAAFNNDGSLFLAWSETPDGTQHCWNESINALGGTGIDDGNRIFLIGPVRAPYLRVVLTPPSLTAGTATFAVDVDGMHQIVAQPMWQTEIAGLQLPTKVAGDLVDVSDRPARLLGRAQLLGADGATIAKVATAAPAATDPGLVTRPLLGGAYAGRVRIHFGTDQVTTLTTSAVANTEAAATLRRQRGTAVAVAVSSYTVTAGKRLRLVGGHLVVAHSAAGGVWFGIRLTTALTGTQAWYVCSRAQAAGHLVVPITLPDGFEFDAGEILQFSTIANVASQPVEVQLWGFEYDTP